MKYLERAKEVIAIEIEALQKAHDTLGLPFSEAVRLILDRLNQGGKIVVTGVGKSFHIGQKIASTLSSTGSTSVVIHPSQAMHGDLGILSKNDVLLAISYNGESEELLAMLPVVKRQAVKIVALTGEPESSLAKNSDIVVSISVDREACPFNLAPTASTTATLAVGDALAIVLLEARGFTREDYAKLHPGGAIGSTLLLRVADIMRTGERLAWVREDGHVKDAIVAMTGARSGSVGVLDKDRRLLGILTDGDLRRLISTHPNVPDLPVRDVMTSNPVTISPENLAVDVLSIYEERAIDDLLVVDKAGRLVGLVDIQDLPKFKIL